MQEREHQTIGNPREVAQLQQQLELKEWEGESVVEQLERKEEQLQITQEELEREREEKERSHRELVGGLKLIVIHRNLNI